MAGMSGEELRALVRGDPPTETPNPRLRAQVISFVLHIRPRYYLRASTRFTYTWRLGWLSVFFFVIEAVTGVILMVFYAPTPDRAYGDMLKILGSVPFGRLMRDLHRLGAEGMVAVVVLHMVRVFFTASYKAPRRFTWVTGVILLVLTLVLSFSGYLLPWDQLSYWAVTVGTSMARSAPLLGAQIELLLRGAPRIWADGLLRFYVLHVVALPAVAVAFICVHYYKVAREHSISLPAAVEEGQMDEAARRRAVERVYLIPDLLLHELMLASVTLAAMVLAAAAVFDMPLEAHADPLVTPLHTSAPWYFLWLQGLLKLGDPTLMGILVPTAVLLVLFAVPWLDRNPSRLARRRKVAVGLGCAAIVAVVVLSYMGTPGYAVETPAAQDVLSHYVPESSAGPFHDVPWKELATGPEGVRKTYFVSYPKAWETDPRFADAERYEFVKTPSDADSAQVDQFHRLLLALKTDVERRPALMAPVDNSEPLAAVTVESLTPDLKWVVATITWDEIVSDPRTGRPVVQHRAGSLAPSPVLRRETRSDRRPEQETAKIAVHR